MKGQYVGIVRSPLFLEPAQVQIQIEYIEIDGEFETQKTLQCNSFMFLL